jgi:hypothetical protein
VARDMIVSISNCTSAAGLSVVPRFILFSDKLDTCMFLGSTDSSSPPPYLIHIGGDRSVQRRSD